MDFLTAWWMYALGAFVVVFVISQSLFFMVKASKEAQALGVERRVLVRTVVSSMVFSIAPSIAILLGLLTLAKLLGVVIPWIRLSILGAVTYELPATFNVVVGVFQGSTAAQISDPQVFVTVVWVMTFGVLPPLIIIPLFLKRILGGVKRMQVKDRKWGELFMNAMFIGMISVFLGYVIAPRTDPDTGESAVSILAVLTLLTSALLMAISGILITKGRQEWLKNYAIPLSMIGAMALAVAYHALGVR